MYFLRSVKKSHTHFLHLEQFKSEELLIFKSYETFFRNGGSSNNFFHIKITVKLIYNEQLGIRPLLFVTTGLICVLK